MTRCEIALWPADIRFTLAAQRPEWARAVLAGVERVAERQAQQVALLFDRGENRYLRALRLFPARARIPGVRSLVTEGLVKHTETMIIFGEKGFGYSGDENRPAAVAAWLLCDVGVDDPEVVVQALFSIGGVVNAHPVLGRYDLVAYVEASSLDELMRILDEDIRRVPGIERTDTRLVLMRTAKSLPARDREKQAFLGVQRAS